MQEFTIITCSIIFLFITLITFNCNQNNQEYSTIEENTALLNNIDKFDTKSNESQIETIVNSNIDMNYIHKLV